MELNRDGLRKVGEAGPEVEDPNTGGEGLDPNDGTVVEAAGGVPNENEGEDEKVAGGKLNEGVVDGRSVGCVSAG